MLRTSRISASDRPHRNLTANLRTVTPVARRQRVRIKVNVVLVFVLAGVALLAFRATRSSGNQAQSGGPRTATVTTGDVTQTVSSSGTIDAARSVAVNFATAGRSPAFRFTSVTASARAR
jgi:multidrug efflux pump subunit AcrA (membrane-fusion protein)